MKVRNGFVSNSSSSSFIIGLAVIEDFSKFNAWLSKNDLKIGGWDLNLAAIDNIDQYQIDVEGDKFIFEAFTGDTVSIKKEDSVKASEKYQTIAKIAKNKLLETGDKNILIVDIQKDAKYLEMSDDFDPTESYNIDIDFFDAEHQKIFNDLNTRPNEIGVYKADIIFGAGRDG
jgi:hypothetical protein